MKAVINEKETPKEAEYPKLMISQYTGNVVLFNTDTTGVAIFLGDNNLSWVLGSYQQCLDPSAFTPFTGSITLSND